MNTKLSHVVQTANIGLNLFVIALLTVITTQNSSVIIAVILMIDLLVEGSKLLFVKPNADPKIAKTEGSLRTMSSIFNLLAFLLLVVPIGLTSAVIMFIVLVIVIIDTIVEIVELVKMP